MSELVHSDEQKFVKTSTAAKRVGYSPDYVSRLARSGKITARQEGRQWLIDVDSLKLFSLEVASEKQRRSEELREERLRERNIALSSAHTVAFQDRIGRSRHLALVETAIASLGLFVAFNLLWFSVESNLNVTNIATGARAVASDVSEMLSDALTHSILQVASFAFVENVPERSFDLASPSVETGSAVNASDSPEFQGIVVFEEDVDEITVSTVRDSFSDEVRVEFDGEDAGIITPIFREKDDESYRFLLVPVNAENR